VSGFTITRTSFQRAHVSRKTAEEPIQNAQGRPGLPPFEDGHLLAEGEYFERRVGAAAQEDAGRGKECE
jgi:hypothetical protein